MGNKILKYSNPSFKTVNLEIKDFEYYLDDDFLSENLLIDISTKVEFLDKNTLEIFFHVLYLYEVKEEEEEEEEGRLTKLYHSDHLINYDVSLENDSKNFLIEDIANLIGIACIMVRGVAQELCKGNILKDYPIPTINPTELLKDFKKIKTKRKFVEFNF